MYLDFLAGSDQKDKASLRTQRRANRALHQIPHPYDTKFQLEKHITGCGTVEMVCYLVSLLPLDIFGYFALFGHMVP